MELDWDLFELVKILVKIKGPFNFNQNKSLSQWLQAMWVQLTLSDSLIFLYKWEIIYYMMIDDCLDDIWYIDWYLDIYLPSGADDPIRSRVWADDPLYARLPWSGHCTHILICIFVACDRMEGSNWGFLISIGFIYIYWYKCCYHVIYDDLDVMIDMIDVNPLFSAIVALCHIFSILKYYIVKI